MNVNAIGHYTIAVIAIVGIIVLQALHQGNQDIFALLGAVAGFTGNAGYTHTLTGGK